MSDKCVMREEVQGKNGNEIGMEMYEEGGRRAREKYKKVKKDK